MSNGQPMGAGQEQSNKSFNIPVSSETSIPAPIPVRKKSERTMGELGAGGIIIQALRLFRFQFKFFVLVVLFVMFPITFVAVLIEYIIYRTEFRRSDDNHGLSELRQSFDGHPYQLLGYLILVFFIVALLAIACKAAINVASSAMLYAVGLHYSGHDVSFKPVMRVCMPRKWMRLTVTTLYQILFLSSLVGGFLLAFLLLTIIHKHQATQSAILGLVVVGLLVQIVGYCLEIIFMVAGSVSVLEKAYGWAAVTKSLRLLKGKRLVAAVLLLLWLVPTFITYMLSLCLIAVMVRDTSALGVFKFLVGAHLYCAWIVYMWRVKDLCAGILYVSCKAYHKESLVESFHQTGTAALEYKRMKSAIFSSDSEVGLQPVHGAKVGGQQVNDTEVGGQQATTNV